MRLTLVAHILAGSIGLIAGYIALHAAKGAPLHRKAGRVFVAVMLAMTFTGVVLAAVRGAAPEINIPAALVTGYLVVTGLTTVRPPVRGARWIHLGGMVLAATVGLVALSFGFEAVARGESRSGMPAFPFFMFAALGLSGAVGDLRLMRSGPLKGTPRIARHLWRMSFALFIAAMSFFLGQADVIPRPIRVMPLLVLPPFAVLGTLLYWVWRVRIRRSIQGLAGVRTSEAV